MDSLRSPWLAAFGLAVVAHLALVLADARPWDSVTKCLIAPLLAAWVVQQRGPRLLVLALACCLLGDLFLEIDGLFIAGMAAFAAAHVCFVTFFARRGALERLRARPWIPLALLVAAVSTTAATALAVDLRAGVGALLFLFSDGLIAARIAERVPEDSAFGGFVVMLTYSLALFFLATAIVFKEARSREVGFDPTRRTDCWPTMPEAAR